MALFLTSQGLELELKLLTQERVLSLMAQGLVLVLLLVLVSLLVLALLLVQALLVVLVLLLVLALDFRIHYKGRG